MNILHTSLVVVLLLVSCKDSKHNGTGSYAAEEQKMMATEETTWIKKSPHSVKVTIDRLETILKTVPSVKLIARINQQDIAASEAGKVAAVETLLYQNSKLVSKILQTNIAAADALPIKSTAWEDKQGQVWIKTTDIDALDKAYNLEGADGAINTIQSLLPNWINQVIGTEKL